VQEAGFEPAIFPKTKNFGHTDQNSAEETVLVSDGLPKATAHLDWLSRVCSLLSTVFQVGFGFWRSRVLNGSLGQAVDTSERVEQHQPSDKYLYQLRACAHTLIQRSCMSFKLSCLRPFSMHAKSCSRTSSAVYFQGIFISTICKVHVATFEQVVADVSMFYTLRMVVKSMSIIGTYEVVQTRCRSSVSYGPCVTVSVMHS
jgi:hypothetical protein